MVHKIIVDTDPGVDDTIAILLLLASPEVSLELISVTFGNTFRDQAFVNILQVYHLMRTHLDTHPELVSRFPNLRRSKKTRIARGASGPLEGSLNLAGYFHGPDGLSGISTTHPQFDVPDTLQQGPHPDLDMVSEDGCDAILSILRAEPPNTVTILVLGPLTTIAQALRKDLKTFAKAERIVSMGGTFDVPGNTSASSEFNFFTDPYAAEEVLKVATLGQINLVLIPLDITSLHTIPFSSLIRASSVPVLGNLAPEPSPIEIERNILHDFTDAILTGPRKTLVSHGHTRDVFEMHDPVAAYFVIDHARSSSDLELNGANSESDGRQTPALRPGWETTIRKFVIERKGEWTKGMCVVDRRSRGTLEAVGNVRSKPAELARADAPQDSTTLAVPIVTATPGARTFQQFFLERVYLVPPTVSKVE